MPTPSPNQPPNPPTPPSITASTCPDDVQVSARSAWRRTHSHDDRDVDMSLRADAADGETMTAAMPDPQTNPESSTIEHVESAGEEHIIADEQTSAEPSSRGTTMSPAPRATTTARTSPVPPSIDDSLPKHIDADIDISLNRSSSASYRRRTATPASARPQPQEPAKLAEQKRSTTPNMEDPVPSLPMGSGYSSTRAIPICPSSFLRPGSKFHGTQQSERQVYDVQVEIKQVDMRESFLCGYLRIQGLTADHPTLTTYFEGEIIGDTHGFFTKHDDWGANSKVDLSHWSKFSAFRPFQKYVRKGPVNISDAGERENIFMRWKEHFLVPDHRVRTISGASFEGFYYICFNQVKGEVSGIYFHSKSEKFQQLELKHVPDSGCFSAIEFR